MANRVQELTYGITGQKLILDVREGRPASVTDVQIFDIGDGDDDAEETAPGSNAVEPNPATTIAATSGFGQSDPTLLTLTAGTGVTVGRTYLATNTLGEKEWVTVKAVSGTSVYATSPLKNQFAASASSTFQSTRLTSTINATWIAEENNISDAFALTPAFRVRWTYVVGTTAYVTDTYFDVVRYPWVHGVTEADMRGLVHDWDERLPTHHREDGGARMIERASIDVRLDLKRAGIDPALIRHSETRDELVLHRAAIAIEQPGTVARDDRARDYRVLMDGLVRVTRRVPVATDTTGAGAQTQPRALWGK